MAGSDHLPALTLVAPVVKRRAVDLASDLGIGVRECRSLEHDLVWADVVGLTASG